MSTQRATGGLAAGAARCGAVRAIASQPIQAAARDVGAAAGARYVRWRPRLAVPSRCKLAGRVDRRCCGGSGEQHARTMAALAPRCRRLCKHRLVRRFGAAGWGVAVFGTVASSAEAFGCVLRSANVLLRFCDANCSRQDKTSQGKESPAQANGGYVWEHPAARGRRSSRRRGLPHEETAGSKRRRSLL